MSPWNEGYVSEIDYTYGYYSELNPLRIQLAFLNAGLVFPEVGNACELGFGQGLSSALHATASVIQWHGNDFNPSQASFAKELVNLAGLNTELSDASFADYADDQKLPQFDYIGLHGIWSWISDSNRSSIVNFIQKKLKIGGVVYISYNTFPGWSYFAPIRYLMTQHADIMGSEGNGIVSRINGSLAFTDSFLASGSKFLKVNPHVAQRFETIKSQNKNYIAHEYFNHDWHPMYFSDMADWMKMAKLQYACSAHYLDHIDAINLTADQQSFLNEIPDQTFKQSVRDFVVNQQFRRDYWVKGIRHLNPIEQTEKIRQLRVILTTCREDISLKVTGDLGEANMTESVYVPLLDSLADYKIKSIFELEIVAQKHDFIFSQLVQAIMLLVGTGHVSLVQEESVISKARKQCDRMNSILMEKARSGTSLGYLASPVTGGAVALDRFQTYFLMGIKKGKKTSSDWANYALDILNSQGQRLVKEGKIIEDDHECLEELKKQASEFEIKKLKIVRVLQLI